MNDWSSRRVVVAVVGSALAMAASSSALAAVIYVKADAGGANNGTSWTDAYTGLQSALAAAVAGDEIWVAAGTYRPAEPWGDPAVTFKLRNGVGVYGGFNGTETQREQRDWVSQ